MQYDVDTIKKLIQLANERQAEEAVSFLLEFLETLVEPAEFRKVLSDIGQGD